jgi:branched-chain amino acid transport system permease protein
MVMVILGGMGSLFGPVIGAVAFLVLEEILPFIIAVVGTPFVGEAVARQGGEYWQLVLGPLLLLIVLFGRGGIMGLLGRFSRG